MKLNTLLEIVAELKRNTDIKTIAEKYDVSERTLYRYKKELNEYVNCVEVSSIAPPTTTDKSDTTATTATDKSDTVVITNSMNLHNIKKRIIRR